MHKNSLSKRTENIRAVCPLPCRFNVQRNYMRKSVYLRYFLLLLSGVLPVFSLLCAVSVCSYRFGDIVHMVAYTLHTYGEL